ncbi:MAG TPA: hypothetical protein VF533_08835 [Solirubrobacteraceae bacterium]|jgi:hypothetical protein
MRRGDPITDLRRAIGCLPVQTRQAMLDGVRANDIVVGAYTDGNGGVCPMLAAHRNGGRTTYLAFARAWDRLGGVTKKGRTRRATARELRILTTLLEASLQDEVPTDLHAAIAEHQAAKARRLARRPVAPAGEIRAGRLTARRTLARFERELERQT